MTSAFSAGRLTPEGLLRTLRVAADDLDLLGDDRGSTVLHLEGDVLDEESPDLVAETVRIQRTLEAKRNVGSHVSLVSLCSYLLSQDRLRSALRQPSYVARRAAPAPRPLLP